MKKLIPLIAVMVLLAASCKTTSKYQAYNKIYEDKPVSVLLMPPINKSTKVEAKQVFHSTLNVPLANNGYYVVPPFLSMEILKQESAYNAEEFINKDLTKFGKVFGADVVLYTIIHDWSKSALFSKITVEIEYIIKSTKTNDILFSRKGEVIYDTSVSTGSSSLIGAAIGAAASAVNTALTKYVKVARACNNYALQDLPSGKYNPRHIADSSDKVGEKEFKVSLP